MSDHTKWASGTALPSITSATEAARIYLQFGWPIVPIPLGSKKPSIPKWIEQAFGVEHVKDPCNIGLNHQLDTTNTVCVDLDCKEAAVLATLMPETGAITGRESKHPSHLYYVVDAIPGKSLQLKDENNSVIVELRCRGGQTLLPPSVHPSGERLIWMKFTKLGSVTWRELERWMRALAAAVILARHWPSDGRHDLSLAVGGVFARAGYSAEDVERIVQAICAYTSDPKPEDRVRTARDAVERYAEGFRI